MDHVQNVIVILIYHRYKPIDLMKRISFFQPYQRRLYLLQSVEQNKLPSDGNSCIALMMFKEMLKGSVSNDSLKQQTHSHNIILLSYSDYLQRKYLDLLSVNIFSSESKGNLVVIISLLSRVEPCSSCRRNPEYRGQWGYIASNSN
jgi:hypothetical protein